MATVHDAAVAVLQKNGEVTGDDVVKQVVSGVAFGRKIWVSFNEATPGVTTVTTQARSSAGGPDVDVASEIDKLIYGQLARSQNQ
jgi:archaellin